MDDSRLTQIQNLLRAEGAQTASQLGNALGISQPTVSRAIADMGDRVVRIGRARASRYALGREIARAGRHWPLYRIDPTGQAHRLGELHALHGDGFYFEPSAPMPALFHGEFAEGLFSGLPWFLDDQRPQGFLGRAFARRVAADIGAPEDLARWQADDVILALLRHGDDPPGDLVLGEAALQRAMQDALHPVDAISTADRETEYPRRADAALRGEDIGSSAGGEQPKFVVRLREGKGYRSEIVKFSERSDTPAGQRWSDLLRCERIAGDALAAHDQDASQGEIIEADGRTFLQSARFDRTPVLGRRGFVSLAALDSAYYGHGRIDWWRFAPQLQRDGWIDAGNARRLRILGWFGALIANSDMHLGNAGLILDDARPLTLAPAYDMLPMHFRPAASGEVVPRGYAVTLPTPESREDWRTAAGIARDFWNRVADEARISGDFRAIAGGASTTLGHAMARQG
ncbi:MAG TPA: type II toxin-antitoxin system HipA family toxin YjjJ [Luteimonas sp.]|nr:type II toxin-antitoxin system HipA family toxin YjjJ [Luteimonas sp.]